VEVHDDLFPGEGKPADHEWLQLSAEKGWVAVTHDANIRYTSRSREAVVAFGARLIVVKGKGVSQDLAENFVRTYSVIRRFIQAREPPWIAKLYRNPKESRPGRIEMWYEPER
jgi:hypothetical protein